MDAYDRFANLEKKKNLANIIAIYGRGRDLFRPPTYLTVIAHVSYNFFSLIPKLS